MARSEEFAGGAEEVRQPQFRSVQTQHNANFHALSVLDLPSSLPNQNGMGQQDLQRRMMGVTDSVSGRSTDTFDKQLWMHHPEPLNRKQVE